MEYAILININTDFLTFLKFLEINMNLRFKNLNAENSLKYQAFEKTYILTITDQRIYKFGDRVITQYCMEDYGVNLNTIMYLNMLNTKDIDSRIWGYKIINLLKIVMGKYVGDCILLCNGYDVPIMLRKNGKLIIDVFKPESKVFDFSHLKIDYEEKKIS